MNIIKKTGKVEKFDLDKIKTSIENSAYDINFSLNNSDVKMLLNEISKILKVIRKDKTSSYEIRGIIHYVLYTNDFKEVAKAYMNF